MSDQRTDHPLMDPASLEERTDPSANLARLCRGWCQKVFDGFFYGLGFCLAVLLFLLVFGPTARGAEPNFQKDRAFVHVAPEVRARVLTTRKLRSVESQMKALMRFRRTHFGNGIPLCQTSRRRQYLYLQSRYNQLAQQRTGLLQASTRRWDDDGR